MARFDLPDAEWAVIEPALPKGVRDKDWVDDRRVLDGVFWRLVITQCAGRPARDRWWKSVTMKV